MKKMYKILLWIIDKILKFFYTETEIKEMEESFTRNLIRRQKVKTDFINAAIEDLKSKGISRKDISDGYHTFEELYYHRMILFSVILNQNKNISWKSKQHHDGTMFDKDSFICGIETPEGQYTYHYKLDYWDNFNVKELEYAPEWDGHQPKDITRLLSLLKEVENESR